MYVADALGSEMDCYIPKVLDNNLIELREVQNKKNESCEKVE